MPFHGGCFLSCLFSFWFDSQVPSFSVLFFVRCAFAAQTGAASDYDASDLESRVDGSVSMDRRAFEAAGFHTQSGPGYEDQGGNKTVAPAKKSGSLLCSPPPGQDGKWGEHPTKARTVTKRYAGRWLAERLQACSCVAWSALRGVHLATQANASW